MSFQRKKFSKRKMGTTMSGNASGNKATAAQNKSNYNILQQFNAEQQQSEQQANRPPQPIVKSPHEKCKEILDELSNLEKDVESFDGIKNDKAYLKLEEFLTRCLLKLDEIDRGDEQININRKNLINFTHTLTEKLEVIATANLANKGANTENTIVTLNQSSEQSNKNNSNPETGNETDQKIE